MSPTSPSRRSAFTLIELLVVIAIIGIISSILLGVTGRVRENANRATCISNLRQIGTAALAYESDHNGLLPGPTAAGQSIYYSKDLLITPLAPYLGLPATPNNQLVPIMRCPSWKQVAVQPKKYSDAIVCYAVDYNLRLPGGANFEPLGYPGVDTQKQAAMVASLEGQPLAAGTSCSATPTFTMTGTMLMTDCDQLNWAFANTSGWYSNLPKKPVHGTIRNSLFYDMHAEARPASMIP